MSDRIYNLFSTSIQESETAITNFVDRVQPSYLNSGAGQMSEIEKPWVVGRLDQRRSYEPLIANSNKDLNYSLGALSPVPALNLVTVRDRTYGYVENIYRREGSKVAPPTTSTYAGDLGKPNQAWQIEGLSERQVANPARTGTILSGDRARSLADPTFLMQGMQALATQLASTEYGIGIEVERVLDTAGNFDRIRVKVPDIDITPTGILRQEGREDLLRSKNKTFDFRPTQMGGTLELGTNRYIGNSYVGASRQSSVETTVGMVRTYVLQQQVLLEQSTSLAFKQFLTNERILNPAQSYQDLDRFLGRAVGSDSTFTQYLSAMKTSGDVTSFIEVQSALRKALLPPDPKEYSQVSINQLAEVRETAIARVLKPLGANISREEMSARVIQNLARELLSPVEIMVAKNRSVQVDGFLAVKQEILLNSTTGRALLGEQMYAGRKTLLETLRAPFLQPHEANFSGGQLLARMAYYAPDGSLYQPRVGLANALQLGGVYKHGSGQIDIGNVYIPISAQSSDNRTYKSRSHDSQLSATSKETTSFYDLKLLFSGNRQLNITSIDRLAKELDNYSDRDEYLKALSDSLNVTSPSQTLLITPYRKPEQIPQRLKNLSGTRPAVEYSQEFYRTIKDQGDLSPYFINDSEGLLSLDRGRAVSANLNTTLPELQFEILKELQQQEREEDLVSILRRIEANPLAEVRGFTTNAKLKRVLVATGANQMSDYMHLNAAHQAVYGYEQFTKIELERVESYDPVGGKLYASNITSDRTRALLQRAFGPGHQIYYGETALAHAPTLAAITADYQKLLLEYSTNNPEAIGDKNVRQAIALKIKSQYEYIRGLNFKGLDAEGNIKLDATLHAGMYGIDNNQLVEYGRFDGDSSRLYVGLKPTIGLTGEIERAQRLTVKMSGRLREHQGGVAVTNDILDFNEIDGRMTAHASYTILFDGSTRPGVENIKGPGRYDRREIFDYYDNNLPTFNTSARTRTDNNLYGIVSPASLKGYAYESGLDVLSTTASTKDFISKLRQSNIATVLLATYFAGDLSKKAPNQHTQYLLKDQADRLQAVIAERLGNSSYAEQTQAIISGLSKSRGLSDSVALFSNNAGLFNLIDSKASKYEGLGIAAPMAQLQESLLTALESGNDDLFLNRVITLFERAQKSGVSINGYITFNQADSNTRAASVLSNLLSSSLSVLEQGQKRAQNAPITGSVLELNLIDLKTGRLNHEVLFGSAHQAAIDLLYRAKADLPRAKGIENLRQEYLSRGEDFDVNRLSKGLRANYNRIASAAASLYRASQQAIPIEQVMQVAPSKILQAAGSKETANLEYHYSIAMSKQQIDKMRGYVSEPDELTELAAGYRMLVRFTQAGTSEQLRFVAPNLNSPEVANYRRSIGALSNATTLHQSLKLFEGKGNLFDEYARLAVGNDDSALADFAIRAQLISQTVEFHTGSTELQARDRAIALASLFDRRRLAAPKNVKLSSSGKIDPKSKFVFFDIETTGLIDKRYPNGDQRRYPSQSINEFAFIFKDGQNESTISWGKENATHHNRGEALAEVAKRLKTDYQDGYLVGHNIRDFDIPTLNALMKGHGVDLTEMAAIDTLADVDRVALKDKLGTNKHTLGNLFKQVSRLELEASARAGDETAKATLARNDYGEYAAHEAEADVKANIKVFDYMRLNGIFKAPMPAVGLSEGVKLFANQASLIYFDAAKSSSIYMRSKELVMQMYIEAKGENLHFYFERKGLDYLKQLSNDSTLTFKAEIGFEYARELLNKSLSASGQFAGLKDKRNLGAYLDRVALAHDREIEQHIVRNLGATEGTYIENLQHQALAFKNQEVRSRLAGNLEEANRAKALYESIYYSRAIVMPAIEFSDNYDGTFNARTIESKIKGKAIITSSLMYLGTDLLSNLPKEFEDYTPQLIRHRRELDTLLPDYYAAIERVQTKGVVSRRDRALIEDMSVLSARNHTLMYETLGGALAQRAAGEKSKTSGMSSTSVASYLLAFDEIGLGSRFTSVLGQKALRRIAAATGKQYGKDEVLVFRAGGPSGASQLDQTYKVVTINELSERAKASGSLTGLDPKANMTTSLLPLYGRFSSQGGDFDGDSYAIIGRYESELDSYADLLDADRELALTERRYQASLYRDRDIFVSKVSEKLGAVQSRAEANAVAERNYRRLQITKLLGSKNADGKKLLSIVWKLRTESKQGSLDFGKYEAKLAKHLGALNNADSSERLRANAAKYLVEFYGFSAEKASEKIAGLYHTFERRPVKQQTLANEREVYAEEISRRFYTYHGKTVATKAAFNGQLNLEAELTKSQIIERGKLYAANHVPEAEARYLEKYGDETLDTSEEIAYVNSQLERLKRKRQLMQGEIKAKASAVSNLLTSTYDIAERGDAAMRRHVAAYTGMPLALLSKEAGLFTSAQVYHSIEQHRGVTPGFESLDPSIVNQGDFAARLTERSAQMHAYLQGASSALIEAGVNPFGLNQASHIAARSFIEGLKGSKDIDTKAALERTILETPADELAAYTPTELLNRTLDLNDKGQAVALAFNTISKIAANAGGTTLTDKTFHALQATIGSAGTNLIGEAYNAVTLMMGKAMFARSLSEALPGTLATGIEGDDSMKFLNTTRTSLERLFPAGGEWESVDDGKAKLGKDLLLATFANPNAMQRAAFDRAQALTGLLANVQQSVRDSLKQKVDGGMLQSIMGDRVLDDTTAYDMLTSDLTAEEDRLPALRKFLSRDAGIGILRLPGEQFPKTNLDSGSRYRMNRGTIDDRYAVTAYGAMFLLNDYLSLSDPEEAGRMVFKHQNISSGGGPTSYGFLSDRYNQVQTLATVLGASTNPHDRERAAAYASMLEPDRFVAQTTIDMLNMSIAERSVSVSYSADNDNGRSSLERMQMSREAVRLAFANNLEGNTTGISNVAISDLREQMGLDGERTRYHRDVAAALFFDPQTGDDLFTNEDERVKFAESLGILTKDGKLESKEEIEFYQRMTTNFIYHNVERNGLQIADLEGMRDTARAIKFLRFGSLEGGTTFRDFTNASANAIEALTIQTTRDQISDPAQMAKVSYEAGSQLFDAMHQLHNNLQQVYGKIDLNNKASGIPLETMQAYQAAEKISGTFAQMFGDRVDPDVREHAERMFGLALTARDAKGKSGWQELSHFLGGMAQVDKTERALMFAATEGKPAEIEHVELMQSYKAAAAQSPEAKTAYITSLGAAEAERSKADLDSTPTIDDRGAVVKAARRHNALSSFIGPVVGILLASGKTDPNLTEHAFSAFQAAAQVSQMRAHRNWSAASMFQAQRIKDTIASEGVIFGTVRGASGEIAFESISKLAHKIAGTQRSSARSYLGELGGALLGMLVSNMTTNRRYGALNEAEENYQEQAIAALPAAAIGLTENVVEEFLGRGTIETDFESEIEYEANLNVKPSSLQEQINAGWIKSDPYFNDDDARADAVSMDYTEIEV